MTKPYKVIAIHFCEDCNLKCPMCYQKANRVNGRTFNPLLVGEMMPYLAEMTDQVALGGGEPFLFPGKLMEIAKTAVKNGLICNVTTNGHVPVKPEYVKDVTMVSVSFDKHKWPTLKSFETFGARVRQLEKHTRVGTNLLIDQGMFKHKRTFPMIVSWLFDVVGVERVFALYPKNWEFIDILPSRDIYAALSMKYEHFYVDDLTNMILTEQKYSDWSKPCHYGRDVLSINMYGEVTGCSFDHPEKSLIKLKKPEDILKVLNMDVEERHSCPYLIGGNIYEVAHQEGILR